MANGLIRVGVGIPLNPHKKRIQKLESIVWGRGLAEAHVIYPRDRSIIPVPISVSFPDKPHFMQQETNTLQQAD
jgi:hypothetical protein